MIPLRDEGPKGNIPFINLIFIGLNIWFYIQQPGHDPGPYYQQFGVVPAKLVSLPLHLFQGDLSVLWSLFTSLFVHGSLTHIAFNMLYLWIFGDNIEYFLGHTRYIFFYLACGLIATLSQVVIDPLSEAPIIGASGAISGIMGAYLLKFPRNRVTTMFIFIILIKFIRIRALYLLGFWILYQGFMGYNAILSGQQGGVAWFAHIGGFVAGMILVNLFRK
jgi:membrane associated rhomboid family serine protease